MPHEFKRKGAEKISELFTWFTAETNHLDEEAAFQRTLGHSSSILFRVRDRLRTAFTKEMEALKLEHGIA